MSKLNLIPATVAIALSVVPARSDSAVTVRPESGILLNRSQDCRADERHCDGAYRQGDRRDPDRGPPEKDRSATNPSLVPETGGPIRDRNRGPVYRYRPPTNDDYSHFRITCSQGINILKNNGFVNIEVRDCEGNYFAYLAERGEYRYLVSLFAQGGRIVSIFPL
jgi:hypothetical protein